MQEKLKWNTSLAPSIGIQLAIKTKLEPEPGSSRPVSGSVNHTWPHKHVLARSMSREKSAAVCARQASMSSPLWSPQRLGQQPFTWK